MKTEVAAKTTDGSPSETRLKTDLTARLDRLPWGRFHTVITIALGVGWTLAAFQTNIIGNILGQVAQLWRLSPNLEASLVSAWVLGVFIGAMFFGYYSDHYGRKKTFIITILCHAVLSMVTAFCWDFYSLLTLRFLTALAIGGEYAVVSPTTAEFIPRKHRGKVTNLILAGFPVGAMLASLAAMVSLKHLPPNIGWRMDFGVGAVLAVLGLWARFAIPESPRWLAAHGREEEAEKIVADAEQSIIREKGIALEPVTVTTDLGVERFSFGQRLKDLFSHYFARLSLACSLNFAQASVVYGIMALLTLMLESIHVSIARNPSFYLIGNTAGLAGGLLAAYLVDAWGRKGTVLLGYIMTTAGAYYLYFARTPMTVLIGYSLLEFSVMWASNSAYVVTSEILPIRNRATGLGIAVASGRVGAFISPLLLSSIFASSGKPSLSLLALTVMTLPGPLAALIWCLKGIEGKNRSLEEICREVENRANGRQS